MAISDFYELNSSYKTRAGIHIRDSKGDSLHSTAAAVDLLENVKVHAVIVPTISSEELFLAKLCDKANVPVLSFSFIAWKHPYFFHISEDETTQFHVIASIIETFKWRSCAFLYEDTADARMLQSHAHKILQENNRVDLSYHTAIFLRASDDRISNELQKLLKMKNSIFFLHLRTSLAARVLANAQRLGMMRKGFAWIVTTMTMNSLTSLSSSETALMQGVVGIKSYIPPSSRLQNFTLRWRREFGQNESDMEMIKELNIYGLWAYDAVWALNEAIERANPIIVHPNQISNIGGPSLAKKIAASSFIGLTGVFRFANRKLMHDAYEVVNVMGKEERRVGFWTSALGLSKEMDANNKSSTDSSLETIIWPGISVVAPPSRLVQTSTGRSFRVGIPVLNAFDGFVTSHIDEHHNVTTFDGLSVDVFHAALNSSGLGISFEFIPFSGSYNDLIMSVYEQTFDAAVGDITITSNRSKYVDFTLPYTDLGVAMVGKLNLDDPWFFVRPLDRNLWIMSGLLFLVMAFVIWLVEPDANTDFNDGTRAKKIGTSLWFAASTLVFAHREKLESNLSKFVVSIWLFVVLILTSSYNATLSSLLTVKQIRLLQDDYIGYSSAILHNLTVNNINFTHHMPKFYYHSAEEYHEALSRGSKNGGVTAIIDEMPYIQLVLGRYPTHYAMIKSWKTTNGFTFAFQKGSPLVHEMSRAISRLRETGKLEEIEKKWFASKSSDIFPQTKQDQISTLSLRSFSYLFIMIGTSIAIAIIYNLYLLFIFLRRNLQIRNYVQRLFADRDRMLLICLRLFFRRP